MRSSASSFPMLPSPNFQRLAHLQIIAEASDCPTPEFAGITNSSEAAIRLPTQLRPCAPPLGHPASGLAALPRSRKIPAVRETTPCRS